MNMDDMQRLGLAEGDRVRLRTSVGETLVHCTGRKATDLLAGVLFMVCGRHADLQDSRAESRGPGMG
jgi:formylmethanofuran dehydrogenase subunit D